jgi:hypothetical protein
MNLQDIYDKLSTDYAERWDDEDMMNPSAYDEYLEGMTDQELLDEYSNIFGVDLELGDLDG